ncbi:hypothetical protein J6590_037326 [Homalodisca vitripennis]|nr:hypothetical protein J6590_037326 [Homalodisca vitripennis]
MSKSSAHDQLVSRYCAVENSPLIDLVHCEGWVWSFKPLVSLKRKASLLCLLYSLSVWHILNQECLQFTLIGCCTKRRRWEATLISLIFVMNALPHRTRSYFSDETFCGVISGDLGAREGRAVTPVAEKTFAVREASAGQGCAVEGQEKGASRPSVSVLCADMLRRPWPPLYRHYAEVAPAPQEWRDYYGPVARDKGRDYYLLAPLYRNAMPPPPPPPPPLNMPRRHLLSPPPCACPCLHRVRSRSLDHVDSIVRSDEESDHYQTRGRRHPGKENYLKRRSMENLLDQRPQRRRAPRPVRKEVIHIDLTTSLMSFTI